MPDHDLVPNALSRALRPSATLAVAAAARELSAQGIRVLDLSAGEPDFAPPPPVAEAVGAGLARGRVSYAPVPGSPALRAAIAGALAALHGRAVDPSDVVVCCGAKHALALIFATTLEPGDEVVIPAPYWVSYPDMVGLAGGRSVIVATAAEAGFKVSPERLAEVLGPATRFVVLNSPSNPTGVGYRADELAALARVIVERAPRAYILADDIYRTLVYGSFVAPSIVQAVEAHTDRVVVVDGLSKSHAMTGWRVGWAWAPRPVIDAMSAWLGQTTSGTAAPAQWAAQAALTDPRCGPALAAMRQAFARRRELALAGLAAIDGVTVVPPDGAFYAFPSVEPWLGTAAIPDDVALATHLLRAAQVATVPGSAFGAPGHLRLSFACADADVVEAVARVGAALAELPRR